MNISEDIDTFNINYVFFLEAIKNTVIDNSSFIRIIYSNNIFTLNGIFIKFKFNNVYLDYTNHRNKYCFNIDTNINSINYIKDLERCLLNKINIPNKIPSNKIYDQLRSGFIKICGEQRNFIINNFILKISGIWESEYEFGLTYKFIDIINVYGVNENFIVNEFTCKFITDNINLSIC